MRTRTVRKICRENGGAAALEFAILSPVFLLIVVGGINLTLLLFSIGSLHYAVEEAARCASVKSTVCASATSIQVYAGNKYFGPAISPTFVSSTASCGNVVSATASFVWHTGVAQLTVPLSARACFP
ncbi:MAG: TadE/TadG family type IV pilus assembly protein [Alphaproteobacteria bacterium]